MEQNWNETWKKFRMNMRSMIMSKNWKILYSLNLQQNTI